MLPRVSTPAAHTRIVLVRPEHAGNVGAVARVMRNFGLSDLVLVAPRLDRPEEAFRWARGAEDLVESATIREGLGPAVADCAFAWATTRRRGRLRGRPLLPREAARQTELRERGGERIAWVFGPESRGLSTADISLCSARVTIPTRPEQPSLNLAQAVAVCCYECALARSDTAEPAPARTAPQGERDALYGQLEASLLAIGFLHPKTARARMAVLRDLLERSAPTPREVAMLRGLARQVSWAAGAGPRRPSEPDSPSE